MKVLKQGNEKFVRVCEVDIYQGTCNACGAVFELEYGEMGRGECGGYHTICCPSCNKLHTDYYFKKLRRQTMLASEVKVYDCLHSPTRQITESEYNKIKQNNNNLKAKTTMQNFDEQAEKYISAVEKQKEIEGKAVDSFTRGDMETCFVSGAQSMEELQGGCEGTFGQAIGSLKRGFLVRRKGWNGKGMFLFMRPFDTLKDEFIIDTVKSLPYNFKEWVKAHPNAEGERFFTQYICMKAADGSIVNGWLASQTDMLSEDWVLVAPYE